MSQENGEDQSDPEPPNPAKSLVEWRNAREELRYRERCVTTYEMVELGPETFHPADIFDKLSPDAARRGREDARNLFRSEVEERVCEMFPSPVAIPFHSFLYGPSDPLPRLHKLRDAWEGLTHLVCALSLAEAVNLPAFVTGFQIRETERMGLRDCKLKDLVGDKLATQLAIADALLDHFRTLNVATELTAILHPGTIREMQRLNSVRNEFSHIGALSEIQAAAFIDEVYPSFQELLVDVVDLSSFALMRLRTIRPGIPLVAEVERLTGHALSRRVRSIAIEQSASSVLLAAGRIGDLDPVLVEAGPRILDLSPFYYSCDDESGHRTRVVFFKGRKEGKWKFEIVGESKTIDRDSPPHDTQLHRFDAVLGVH